MSDTKPMENENKGKKTSARSESRKQLTKKAVVLLIAGLVVVAVLSALAIAWYTRIVNSYSVSFEVADYDLAINQNSEDSFLLDVYQYSQVTEKKMAPGTVGWIPMEISTKYSQVDVQYTIAMENMMPEEIKSHFRTFYLLEAVKVEADTTNYPLGYYYEYQVCYGDAIAHEDDIYNAKITYGTEATVTTRDQLGLKDKAGNFVVQESEVDFTNRTIPRYKKVYLDNSATDYLTDEMEKGTEKTVCLYWEWYLDAARANEDHGSDGFLFYRADGTTVTASSFTVLPADTDDEKAAKVALFKEISDRWDDLDTDIGRYPAKYVDAMQMRVYGSGAQVKPSDGNKVTTSTQATTAAN